MEAACAQVTCFAPLDARPVSVPVAGLPSSPLVVPFGADPTQAVTAFLRDAVTAGHITADQVSTLLESEGISPHFT
jgi:hypothetical protein